MRSNAYWSAQRYVGEDDAAFAARSGLIYFEAQRVENAEWWRRIGMPIDLAGRRVLEIGSGHGALCIEAAARGASHVTGVDPDASRVQFANDHLRARYPERSKLVRFLAGTVGDLPLTEGFDVVLSKDTFEHVEDLDRLVREVTRRLRPNGLLVCGFSPLYYSPNGDHGRFELPLPWLHALLPHAIVLRWASKRLNRPIRSAADVGLNRLTLREFETLLPQSDWERISLRINPVDHALRPVFDLLRRIAPLERFFTVGLYAVFRLRERPAGAGTARIPIPASPGPNTARVAGTARPGQALPAGPDPQ